MNNKIESIITTTNKWLAGSLSTVGSVILGVWTLIMVAGIVGRAFLGWSWLFLEEYTGYFNMAVASFGFAYAVVRGSHIKVRVVVSRLPARLRIILECVTTAVCVWWAILLAQKMSGWFSDALVTGSLSLGTYTPMWIPYLISTIGFATLALATFSLFVHIVMQVCNQLRKGNELTGEINDKSLL